MAHDDQLTMTFLAVWMESLPWFHDFIKWTWWRYRSNCFERTPWSFQPFWTFKTNRTSINNNKQLHGEEDHHHHDYTQQFSSHPQGEQKTSTIETTSLSRKQPSPPQFVVQLLHSSLRWAKPEPKMPGFPPQKSFLKGKLSYPDGMFRDVLFFFGNLQ